MLGGSAACQASMLQSRSSKGSRHQIGARARHGRSNSGLPSLALLPSDVLPPVGLPSEAELLWAVHSLYDDKLRPCSRLLRLRLAEQHGSRGNELRNCDEGQLMVLCKSCASLHVEASDAGGEWCALLVTRPSDFVDVYSEVDHYPEVLWHAAEAYFKSLGESSDHKLPRGRYASARELMSRRLPFLMGYALGHVCHLVQIAISKRKLLGYVDGGIVPYARCTSMVKSRCAQNKRPLPAPNATTRRVSQSKLEVADWETARAKLREILGMATEKGSGPVQLSNVKRLFRSLFQTELSETALGHTTLTGLLNDARLCDLCTVQAQDRGHVVVPVPSLANSTMPSNFSVAREAAANAEQLPRWLSIGKESDLPVQPVLPVERTFIHFGVNTPRATLCKAAHRSRSLPAAASLDTTSGSETLEADDEWQDARVQFCINEPLACNEDELQGELCSLRTPSPRYDDAAAWRRMQTSGNKAGKAAAWTDQLTSDDEMEPGFFYSDTTGFPTPPHAIQTSDLSCPSTPGFRARRETLVLSLASML